MQYALLVTILVALLSGCSDESRVAYYTVINGERVVCFDSGNYRERSHQYWCYHELEGPK